ncbi:(2Fe-2S)-binding protein, partial [Bacillus sp. GbtcB13]|uniref:(2Fe-2S)-binding protein n=1 Tax=Bacillus sp. GbtcB13 TaxID=2824758 RepID=UPI001C302F43
EASCGCTGLTRDGIVGENRGKGLTPTEEVMNVLGWETAEGCSQCRPAPHYYPGMINPKEYEDGRESPFVNERMHAN